MTAALIQTDSKGPSYSMATPQTGTPAICIFGRPIRDFIPIHPGKYLPHNTWKEYLINREEALRSRHMRICERLTAHSHNLPPLKIGDNVRIQNQTGLHPTKWDKTGIVIEVRQFDQSDKSGWLGSSYTKKPEVPQAISPCDRQEPNDNVA